MTQDIQQEITSMTDDELKYIIIDCPRGKNRLRTLIAKEIERRQSTY